MAGKPAWLRARGKAWVRGAATPIFDAFNVFNTLNLTNPNVDANSGSYGTIGSAHPSRQFQFGLRFDF